MFSVIIINLILTQYLSAEPFVQNQTHDSEKYETGEIVNLLKTFIEHNFKFNSRPDNNETDRKISLDFIKELGNPMEAVSSLQNSNKINVIHDDQADVATVNRQELMMKGVLDDTTAEKFLEAKEYVVTEADKNSLETLTSKVKRQVPGMDGSHVVIGTFQAFVRSIKGDVGNLSVNATEIDGES